MIRKLEICWEIMTLVYDIWNNILREKSFCPYVRPCVCVRPVPSCPRKKSVKQKISLKKVVRYTSSVTKIHSESCCRHWSAGKGKANPSLASHHTIKFHHVHWSWCPARPLSLRQRQDTWTQWTIWSVFQNLSQTATMRGEAELRLLNFKTTL